MDTKNDTKTPEKAMEKTTDHIWIYTVASLATMVFASSIFLLVFVYLIDDYGYALQGNQENNQAESWGINQDPQEEWDSNEEYPGYSRENIMTSRPILLRKDKITSLLDKKATVYGTIKYHPWVYFYDQQKIPVEMLYEATKQSQKTHTVKSLDYIADQAVYKFLSEQKGLYNKLYVPSDLIEITPSESVEIANTIDTPVFLSSKAIEPLWAMAEAYYDMFERPLIVTSSWRSFEDQIRIYQNCEAPRRCATPWHSEHQTWFAVDFQDMYGKTLLWMQNNAWKYWFHQSYQGKSAFSDYEQENWHWRYVGKELATYLFKEDISLTEWYNRNF